MSRWYTEKSGENGGKVSAWEIRDVERNMKNKGLNWMKEILSQLIGVEIVNHTVTKMQEWIEIEVACEFEV